MRKRPIIILALVILVLIGGVIVVIVQRSASNDEAETSEATVQVTGTGNQTRLDPSDDDELVQEAVQAKVQLNEPDATGSYSSIVRKSSIVRFTTKSGRQALRYVVDIPELQRSFAVKREGDFDKDGYSTLYVVCPLKADLKYPEKPCRVE